MKFQTTFFEGIIPRYEAQLLDMPQAQVAENCDVLSGRIDPIEATLKVVDVPAGTKTIFPYPDLNTWLNWTTDVDVVRNPVALEQFNRIYFTGDGVPQVRGTTGVLEEEFPLGVPAPTNILTTVPQDLTATTAWTRTWHYQYENESGAITQEGTLTEPGDITETTPGQVYTLGSIPARTSAGPNDLFVFWFDAFDSAGILLGRLLPEPSRSAVGTDFVLDGAQARGVQTSTDAGGGILTISYDTSRASEYEVFRNYVYTFITQWGEQGPPSLASTTIPVTPAEEAKLSNFDVNYPTVNHTNITLIRIYRTVTTTGGGSFRFVDDVGFRRSPAVGAVATNLGGGKVGIPLVAHNMGTSSRVSVTGTGPYTGVVYDIDEALSTSDVLAITAAFDATPFTGSEVFVITVYVDDVPDGETGEILPSEDWVAPPSDLAGLVSLPNGFFAGFVDRTVRFSVANQPHAWPAGLGLTVDYDIVGLGVSENSVIVCTEGTPYVMTGTSPDVMVPSQLPMRQGCASKRSIASVMNVVIYASPDGLVGVQGGVAELMTESYYRKADWQPLDPSSMQGEVHDNRYHGVSDTDHIIFDFDEARSALVTSDILPTGLYSDLESDTLYMVVGTEIRSWRAATTTLTAKWRSKRFHFSRRMSFNVIRVVAESYPVTVRVFANDPPVQVWEIALQNDEARRMKRLRDTKDWEVEVETTSPVRELTLSTSMMDL